MRWKSALPTLVPHDKYHETLQASVQRPPTRARAIGPRLIGRPPAGDDPTCENGLESRDKTGQRNYVDSWIACLIDDRAIINGDVIERAATHASRAIDSLIEDGIACAWTTMSIRSRACERMHARVRRCHRCRHPNRILWIVVIRDAPCLHGRRDLLMRNRVRLHQIGTHRLIPPHVSRKGIGTHCIRRNASPGKQKGQTVDCPA